MGAVPPKAIVRQDSIGRWFFLLVNGGSGGVVHEGHHHVGPHSKGRALEDRDSMIRAASRAVYQTEDS